MREIEKQLELSRQELDTVEKRLADETIYTDPDRKADLTDLMKDQASLKSAIDTLEWDWMEASETLEVAGNGEKNRDPLEH